MAKKPTSVTPAKSAIAESTSIVNAQREALKKATNLLKPGEIAGDYRVSRLLGTTLGGKLRAITTDDLKAFAATVKALGKKFKGGITAKEVISLSLPIDRQRANDEIKTAVPTAHRDGAMHFVTNAGPDSDKTRHHVYVEFLEYQSAVASPVKAGAMVKPMAEGRIRFRCDCGRFTYWYGYLATVGQFIYGDTQVNFPKIRNPHLVGVACKHSLRVMQQLQSPAVRIRLEKMIEDGRKDAPGRVRIVTLKEAKSIEAAQRKQAEWKRNKVESSTERADRLAQQRAAKQAADKARGKLAPVPATGKPPKPASPSPAQMATERRKFEANVKKMVSMGMLTEKQAKAMMAKVGV